MDDGVKMASPDECGQMLYQAAVYNNVELLKDLLSGEFVHHIDWHDPQGRTSLHAAAQNGHLECVQLLLSAGADASVASARTGNSKTPLHLAAEQGHYDVCVSLIKAGADILAVDRAGYCALQLAQMANHHETAMFILDTMQERESQVQKSRDELDKACLNEDAKMVEEILTKAQAEGASFLDDVLNGGDDEVYSALYRCSERGYTDLVNLLLRFGAAKRVHPVTFYSPLYIALHAGHHAIVHTLLQHFPDLAQVATFEGWLPIHAACKTGDVASLEELLYFKYPEFCYDNFTDPAGKLTYRFAFDLNKQDVDCRTPLFIACQEGHTNIVRTLLNFRLQVSELNESGEPEDADQQAPMEDVLVKCRKTSADERKQNETSVPSSPAKRMLGVDDSPTAANIGESPMRKAKTRLHAANASLSLPQHEAHQRLTRPIQVDVYSGNGHTPLQSACAGGHLAIVRMLVNRGGADVNLPIAVTDQQLANMHDLNEGFVCAGSGALIEACKRGDEQIIEFLLEHSAADHDNQALKACLHGEKQHLVCRLLCTQVFADPEFRVNKKPVDTSEASVSSQRSIVPSAMYPAVPSMLNWHKAHLDHLPDDWLFAAATHLNPKMRAHYAPGGKVPSSLSKRTLVTSAISRIDLSYNRLDRVPNVLMQLPSLRILNLANNSVAQFEVVTGERWHCTVLEEIHIQNNQIEQLPNELFAHLPNLQSLDLSHNKIDSLPIMVWMSPKLKDLNLSFNKLASLPSWVAAEGTSPGQGQPGDLADSLRAQTSGSARLISDSDDSGNVSISLNVTDANSSVASLHNSSQGLTTPINDENITVQHLQRHNLWQRSIELSKVVDDDEQAALAVQAAHVAGIPPQPIDVVRSQSSPAHSQKRRPRSMLTSLNLAHNMLIKVPDCLPCVAPALTRLNLANNQLTSMGSVCHYPPRLKHLDLSGNRITSWFGWTRILPSEYGQCHLYGVDTSAQILSAVSPVSASSVRSRSPTSKRRSQSSARVPRAPSVVRSETVQAATAATSDDHSAFMCVHRRHTRFDSLRTLIVAGNRLDRICLHVGGGVPQLHDAKRASRKSTDSARENLITDTAPSAVASILNRQRLQFPCLSMLDASNNQLQTVPPLISELTALSVLNLSNNPAIHSLPPEMGLLTKLWNLTLTGCQLDEPIKTMLDSKQYKTMDIVGYLKSVLEDSKSYARLKLMVVGIQGIGKTTLLEQLKLNGTVSVKKQPSETWAKRMGHKNIGAKTNKGVSISTVGVDVSDWTYEPKKQKGLTTHGPITFRTWDFGGQREYYATHQYFLSRRSLYLVVWRTTDGEAGIDEIQQWLVNIQARAPGSPVIIVGTHFDEVLNNDKKFPQSFIDDLQQIIRERFVAVQDHDKKGLPRVVESVVVSSKTKYNILHLCQIIYSTAYELRSPGSKERLLSQKIPASYLALEEIVSSLSDERKSKNKDPVYSSEQFRSAVHTQMLAKFGRPFRDSAELNQAVAFLHENGVMLHYEDATLKDLYFVDPQWLCDVLAHVITIREINPFAKNGLMRLEDLKLLFKATKYTPLNVRSYILNLLQKFELALTWDGRHLLIPSLLPDEYQLRGGYVNSQVLMPLRSKGWQLISKAPPKNMTTSMTSDTSDTSPTVREARMQASRLIYRQSPDDESMVQSTTSDISGNQADSEVTSPMSPGKKESGVGRRLTREFQKLQFGAVSIIDDMKKKKSPKDKPSPSSVAEAPAVEKQPSPQPPPLFTLEKTRNDDSVPTTSSSVTTPTSGPSVAESLKDKFAVHCQVEPEISTRRVYLMAYVPSGFWSRLLTRLLGDEQLPAIIDKFFSTLLTTNECLSDSSLQRILKANRPQWLLWQTGLEIKAFDQMLLSLKEFLPLAQIRDVNYDQVHWLAKHEDNVWRAARSEKARQLEIYVPDMTITLKYPSSTDPSVMCTSQLTTELGARTRLLSLIVECIDTLLEDWYPTLGTRFVHTSEGKWLVTRLVPCYDCLSQYRSPVTDYDLPDDDSESTGWTVVDLDNVAQTTKVSSKTTSPETKPSESPSSDQQKEPDGPSGNDEPVDKGQEIVAPTDSNGVYAFTVEECILAATEARQPKCPVHNEQQLTSCAPDVLFLELRHEQIITPEQIKRGKMIGRGAFGFVFKAAIRRRDRPTQFIDVALKMLQPVDPGFGARSSAAAAYKAGFAKWQREPSQYACRAYCTARQELNVLSNLHHPHVVSLIGVCVQPLALVVALAPLGALNALLNNYRRSGARLHMHALQQTCSQTAKALEYLHQQHIIYRDLKSENVLVWRYPPPFSQLTDVEVRLGDYGISRSVFPSGGAKGFGGTEGFMAPEIMRYNGEEEYTEKVDCFSFAMFMYELLTLKLPFEGQEQVKELMLDGGRPQLTPTELLYPANVLDAMCVCWSQQPHERPSSSQLVSVTTAPEFTHLLDVVALADTGAAVLVGDAFVVDETDGSDEPLSPEETFEGELWLSRSDGQIAVLSCNMHGWLDYKNIFVNDDSFVTAMCLVEDTVWLGELTGVIRVFCAKSYTELYSFAVAPHVLASDIIEANKKRPLNAKMPVTPLSLPIASITWLQQRRLVLIGTEQPPCLLLCRITDNLGGDGMAHPVLGSYSLDARQMHAIATLMSSNVNDQRSMQIWTGLCEGYISIWSLPADEDKLVHVEKVNHYDPVVEGVEVSRLVTADQNTQYVWAQYVWSYVFPGSTLYQWDANNRRIVSKLDCSKIVPCSESINTMNIDERMNPGRCQVTALSIVSSSGGSGPLLYIGTTWGVVIIAEADHLRPVVAFRPHLEDIRVVLPLNAGKRVGANSYVSRDTGIRTTGTTESTRSNEPPKSTDSNLAMSSGGDRTKQSSVYDGIGTFVLTVGKGYRCLIQRFLDSYREDSMVLESRNRDAFAIMWRTDDWAAS